MPVVDLHSQDDFASIFYTTNTTFNNVSAFDPEKPTIIVLHPLFLDSTWLDNQFCDPRLSGHYNVIAFDMRTCGRSRCRSSGRHDSWVDSADLAFCCQKLHLPPCHILAFESLSINCALRFAVLFPEMCLTLTLCNVPPPSELSWISATLKELMQTWCFAEDLETCELAGMESVNFLFGPECDSELRDELIAFWQMTIPPRERPRFAETVGVLMNRSPMGPEMYASITQPTLLVHGERNEVCPKQYAESLASQLTGVEDGAVLYTVKGAAGLLSIVPGSASIVNQVIAKFLSRFPRRRSDLVPPALSVEVRMTVALQNLARVFSNGSIGTRDPLSSLSFSCLPKDIVKAQEELITQYARNRHQAFSPLGPDGKPLRKFSERRKEHWFQSGENGLSVANTTFLPLEKNKADSERSEKVLSISRTELPEGQVIRPVSNSSAVERYILKGSMTKVIGNTPAMPLHRLLA